MGGRKGREDGECQRNDVMPYKVLKAAVAGGGWGTRQVRWESGKQGGVWGGGGR